MKLASIRARVLAIPFRESFKHASAERIQTQTIWVECETEEGVIGYGEGCPREYVSNESLASSLAFVERFRSDWLAGINSLALLQAWADNHGAEIDANPAAWSAVELALLDMLAKIQGVSVERLLGLRAPAGEFRYTAVLGDASEAAFRVQLERYLKAGFTEFKIKLSGDLDQDESKVDALAAAGIQAERVRADANNLWPDAEAVIAHMQALGFPFMGLEEPIRAGSPAALRRIAQTLDVKIILDESLLRLEQLPAYADEPGHWIVNLRISKMGGILRSMALAAAVRELGIGLIIGAHVGETSLLTRAALTVAGNVGDILVAQEGAFGTQLLETDVTTPSLMFGRRGILDVSQAGFESASGFGLPLVKLGL